MCVRLLDNIFETPVTQERPGTRPRPRPWSNAGYSPARASEVEYVYNVMVRRHFNFPNNDALGYGWGICDKLGRAFHPRWSWAT
ncbi:hypothetical protein MARA_03440 (plasmid) [Mycolicibacterium arabiense]|uniref:Uncharacterized protein n=1 Tax=Mycolicibacterium arabiense TaxID=1286181 RepID=A0A7I7RQU4_9MYCO|nr:hypothetical protein MARA_03440 [Mycolicibacterium arabiense]